MSDHLERGLEMMIHQEKHHQERCWKRMTGKESADHQEMDRKRVVDHQNGKESADHQEMDQKRIADHQNGKESADHH